MLQFSFRTAPVPRELVAKARPEALTNRQRQVLALMVAGLSTEDIAVAKGTVVGTVKPHITGIYRALGVINRTQATAVAEVLPLVGERGPVDALAGISRANGTTRSAA